MDGWTISNTINLGLFLLTALGLLITLWQSNEARVARDKADEHEAAALAASNDSAAAATRSADAATRSADAAVRSAAAHDRTAEALERQAAVAERSVTPEAWSFREISKGRWELKNTSGTNVDFVSVTGIPDGYLSPEDGITSPRDVKRGQSIVYQFGGGLSDPSSLNVKIVWRDIKRVGQEDFFTITS